jgi:hypothetical protein
MVDTIEVLDEPFPGPWPELPKPPGRRKWHDLAVRWWDTIRVQPICSLWDASEWLFAVETFVFKDELFRSSTSDHGFKTTLLAEIRHREAILGTTAEARRRLRVVYVPAPEPDVVGNGPDLPVEVVEQRVAAAGQAGVTSLAERRARLTKSA